MDVSSLTEKADPEFLTSLRRHVLKDIDPYICLFEDCSKPNEHFRNVEDWLNHMKWQHTIVWSCPAFDHKSTLFDSKDEFEQHMNQEHFATFTESQLPLLVQKSAHPASDTFSVLTARNNPAAAQSRYECPLCDFFVEKPDDQNNSDSALLGAEIPTNNPAKVIQHHIAAHLESIALLSLPEQDNLDDDFSIARDSEGTKKNSTRQDDRDDLLLEPVPEGFSPIMDPDYDDILAELAPETLAGIIEETWAIIFTSLGLRRANQLEPAQDVTLRGFVERARYIQMISTWKNAAVPILIIFDPEGIQIEVHDPDGIKIEINDLKEVDEMDQG